MKKRLFCAFITLIMIIACLSILSIGAIAAENDTIVIVIDPGHGGKDPGNTGATQFGGEYESHQTYDISKYVKERLLQYAGVEVYLTREDMADNEPKIPPEERPTIAAGYNADALVSIHTNLFEGTGRAYGAEIWVPDATISYNNEMAITSQTAASLIMTSMHEQTGVRVRPSKPSSLPSGLKTELTTSSSTYPTGEKMDKLAIINGGRKNNIPVAMLIETCFASDESDYNSFLSTTEKRKAMGYAIADGLAEYYELAFSATYGDKLSDVILPAGWAWTNPNASVGNAGVNFFPAVFTADSTRTDNFAIQVEKAVPAYTIPKNISAKYMSTLSDVQLPDGWSWQKSDTLLDREGQYKFAAIFTPEDTDNYITIKAEVYITISCSHEYDNGCDAECNICSATRTPEAHKYNAVCDTTCNVCSATREAAEHKYSNSCSTICSACGEEREITHAYDNDCDTDCNVCGNTRDITHTYSHVCDSYCDICEAKREVNNHTYSNACDPYCDICSEKRTSDNHVYTNSCDTTCDVCGSEREITHTYNNDCDTSCNVCGTTRSVAHAYADEADTECDVCGAVRASVSVNTEAKRGGCRSSISGIIAIISSIAIGFIVIKKRK